MVTTRSGRKEGRNGREAKKVVQVSQHYQRRKLFDIHTHPLDQSPQFIAQAPEVITPVRKRGRPFKRISTPKDAAANDNIHSELVMEGQRSALKASEVVTPQVVAADENMHSELVMEGQTGARRPSEANASTPVCRDSTAIIEFVLHSINQDMISSRREANVALESNNIGFDDEPSAKDLGNGQPRHSISLNLTEIAEMGDDELSDVDSERDNTFIVVSGYRVKPEYASLLTSILFKHGDIGANCSLGSVSFRSLYMEKLCAIYHNLAATSITVITEHEIEDMLASLSDMEKAGVDVGWLKTRLVEIHKAKKAMPLLKAGSQLRRSQSEQKQRVHRLKLAVEDYKNKSCASELLLEDYKKKIRATELLLDDYKDKIHASETDLSSAETEALETDKFISENKAYLKYVWELGSLVGGLV